MTTEEGLQVVRRGLLNLRDHALSCDESQELVGDDIWEDLIGYWKFAMKYGPKQKMAQDADPANERVHSWRFINHCADAALMCLGFEK
jgi:hypothetical protein